jgi:crossover junction endodeoxyribonuclease RuvC
MRILGIDPGSSATGYGVVERAAGRLRHLGHGTLRTPRGAPLPDRLAELHAGLAGVIRVFAPDAAAVEQVFVAASPRAALVLGQARGVALAAAAAAGLEVFEYGTRAIKLAVAGSGAAGKTEVQRMVGLLLRLGEAPSSDAADALATAICCAQRTRLPAAAWGARPRGRGRGRRAGRYVARLGP